MELVAMRLLIDAGNTRIKWSLCAENQSSLLQPGQAFPWRGVVSSDLLDEHWRSLRDIHSVWLSNVAGEQLVQPLQAWVQKRWNLSLNIVSTQAKQLGVTNAYPDYRRLGVDRWLGLLACRALLPGQNICMIDCGSAITVDALQQDGTHLGGMILPGPSLMLQSLQTGTQVAQPSKAEILVTQDIDANFMLSPDALAQSPVYGNNTEECIRRGISHAGKAFMQQILSLAQATLGKDCNIVFTGGYAKYYMSYIDTEVRYFPDLVLQGLSLVAGEVA